MLLGLIFSFSNGQAIENWSADFQLQLEDFQSPQTEINKNLSSYTIYPGSNIDFSYQMNSYEFMFTKNFNSRVKTFFNRKIAIISAPDSATAMQLVKCGQYTFDLTELYARKFRMGMYEEKRAFSEACFFKPIFDQLLEEMNAESARVLKASDLGKNKEVLAAEHLNVLQQIEALADFCFECTPPKKKKK